MASFPVCMQCDDKKLILTGQSHDVPTKYNKLFVLTFNWTYVAGCLYSVEWNGGMEWNVKLSIEHVQ